MKRGEAGDPLSPSIFNIVLEEIFRSLDWKGRGLQISGEYLSNLRFADDLVLIAKNLSDLYHKSKLAGLELNWNKTKIMPKTPGINIEIEGTKTENVEEIVYLGQLISSENNISKEIGRRIAISWKKF